MHAPPFAEGVRLLKLSGSRLGTFAEDLWIGEDAPPTSHDSIAQSGNDWTISEREWILAAARSPEFEECKLDLGRDVKDR
jgi:hypothetical protein